MIVGNYVLELYCRNYGFGSARAPLDNDHCAMPFRYRGGWYLDIPVSWYVGYSEAECRRNARHDGWIFTGNDAECPWCKQKRLGNE